LVGLPIESDIQYLTKESSVLSLIGIHIDEARVQGMARCNPAIDAGITE